MAGDAVRVVLLDVSQSMAATDRGIQALERARSAAAGFLRYRPGLWANLIVAAAGARPVFDGPSTNFEALREELSRAEPLPQRLDVPRALGTAARLLSPASPDDRRRRELVVGSDFQRSNWQRADFSVLPEGTQIQLEAIRPAETPANLSIVRAECRLGSPGSRQAPLAVEVANDSRTTQKVAVEVALGDAVYQLSGVCPAGQRTTLAESIELRQAGWQTGQARLLGVDDALMADNVRPLVARTRPQPVYALITRQGAAERPSSSHCLECALVPDARRQQEEASGRVIRLSPQALDQAALAQAEVIVLDHPGRLAPESIHMLAGLMRRGRPVLYVSSELVDAVNLQRLSEAAGAGLQMPAEFTPPPQGHFRRDLFLTSVRADEAPFRVFGDRLPAVLGRLRFAGGLTSRRLPNAVPDEILATYNDGSACLVLTAADAGALAVLNADLGASNLPKTAACVPLLDELWRRMIERRGPPEAVYCGEPMVVSLPSEAGAAAGLKIDADGAGGPSAGGPSDWGELIDEAGGVVWRWTSPTQPGAYRVLRGEQPVFALAVPLPAEEAAWEGIDPEWLETRLAGGREVSYHGTVGQGERRDDAWTWFAVAAVACLWGELLALLAFRT